MREGVRNLLDLTGSGPVCILDEFGTEAGIVGKKLID
jgi:hypothetical protein